MVRLLSINLKQTLSFIQNLRNLPYHIVESSTMAGSILWDKLRNKKEGYKFRRQHIIGRFIADFVLSEKGLIIEVDGNYHQLPEMNSSK